jgi:hypothetical protein
MATAVITAERDSASLGAPTVEPMAVLTTEHDTAQLAPVETDAVVLAAERDTCTLTAEVIP